MNKRIRNEALKLNRYGSNDNLINFIIQNANQEIAADIQEYKVSCPKYPLDTNFSYFL